MITQAGLRPSLSRRSMRRSIAPALLNGTAIVMSTMACGMPAPYGWDFRFSGSPISSYSTPMLTITPS